MESYLGEILSVACACAWAMAIVLFRRAAAIPAFAINLCKNSLAVVLTGATLWVLDIPIDTTRSTQDWARLLVSGALGLGFADAVFLAALKHLGAGTIAVVECAYAPCVVLFAITLGGESLESGFYLGAPLVVLGVLVASLPPARAVRSAGSGESCVVEGPSVAITVAALTPPSPPPLRSRVRWIVIGAFSVACMALGIVIAKPALEQSNVIEAACVRMVGALAFQFLWALSWRPRWAMLRYLGPGPHWRLILPSALLGSYLAMMMWIGGMKLTEASVSAILNQTSTIFTLIFARVITKEPFTLPRILGAALAAGGAAIIATRLALF